MCLYVSGFNYTVNAKIAKKDIIVFKKVKSIYLKNRGKSKTRFKSSFLNFIYQIGYQYTNNNFPKKSYRGCSLQGEGLHSYKLSKITGYFKSYDNTSGIYPLIECIIPKGTPYYIGKYKDLISESLIIVGKIDYKRYKTLRSIHQKY